MPTQLDNNHGSAAGPDSQVGINAPMGLNDNVIDMNVHDVSIVPAMQPRGFSPLGAGTATVGFAGTETALDETLTDDSLGVTPSPDKATPARGRARSLLRHSSGRPPLTKRGLQLSLSRPRVATRVASPAMQKRLRDVSVPVKAVADAAVGERLAALEQQVVQEHAYKLELVQVVQNLQAMAAAGQQRLEVHDEQAEVNRAEHLELRRELFAMRDQLSEKLNFVVQQT